MTGLLLIHLNNVQVMLGHIVILCLIIVQTKLDNMHDRHVLLIFFHMAGPENKVILRLKSGVGFLVCDFE
jgi:hypothetical protein